MAYDANNMPSYDHFKGAEKRAHMGSQSHSGQMGGPSGHPAFGGGNVHGTGAVEHNPGGASHIGSGGSKSDGF